MKPAACIQGAIEILRSILLDNQSAEKAFTSWGRSHRFAGSHDRRNIQDTVYDVLRSYGTLCYWMQSKDPYHLVAGWLFFIKKQPLSTIRDIFSGERHSPRELSDKEWTLLDKKKLNRKSDNFEERYNINLSLEDLCQKSLKSDMDNVLNIINTRAPLDLRINRRLSNIDEVIVGLSDTYPNIEFQTKKEFKTLIRTQDHINLHQSEIFKAGLIEIQDASSQYACQMMADFYNRYYEGGRILDYCAGGGGKTLALSDMLDDKPEIIASDISEIRLKNLKDRAERNKHNNIRRIVNSKLNPDKGKFQIVLIDAPCSGSGTWRRNVLEKRTTTDQDIIKFSIQQKDILEKAKLFLEDNASLIYMTCSLFHQENDDVIKEFLTKNPEYQAYQNFTDVCGDKTDFGFSFNPYKHDCDGFYISFLKKG